ncbi:uncharacterized protein BP01DRAFT_423594 [Aspergillus saccharolyticus JOP 1030-1]|uniref:Uncharacterized protein n=1 Tax=Aspergillus saccharolyticus JOP 1030-1 TaxID=1450539 RepID=A0A318ZKF7_9EURO|nr:hypothetical protein BP01DRAFT_423594 [Aspergillus saccharolyticus JOP 1030-1]PYH45043.1 hypothetical protein BP01DRAFT_423594 [Aspergillus saccharolyticus JOP 1030-1]
MRQLFCSLPGLPSVRYYTAVLAWQPRSTRCFCRSARLASSTYSKYAINVPVGNNGQIALEVTHPNGSSVQNGNVIIYLPPGPVFNQSGMIDASEPSGHDTVSSAQDATGLSLAQALASSTLSTVVTINYRLGRAPSSQSQDALRIEPAASSTAEDTPTSTEPAAPEHGLYQYPTPIHDTLAGFDWVHQNLQPQRLGVIGTHIGGSLAIMLSLTEAQLVHAVAALEPVADWTALDDHCLQSVPEATEPSPPTATTTATTTTAAEGKRTAHSSRSRKPPIPTAPHDLVPLLHARRIYFTTPERYFDAFASPLLFLRTPAKDVPRLFPEYLTGPGYPIPVLQPKTSQELFEESVYKFYPSLSDSSMSALSAHTSSSSSSSSSESSPETPSPRPSPLLSYLSRKATAAATAATSATANQEHDEGEGGGGERGAVDDDEAANQSPVRRRRSVLRWPPYGLDYGISGPAVLNHPSRGVKRLDVTLPWVRVFARGGGGDGGGGGMVRNSSMLGAPSSVREILAKRKSRAGKRKTYADRVLAHQAVDVVDVMRRACFWGREKGFGESRVSLVEVGEEVWPASAEKFAGEWLREVMLEAAGKNKR